MTEDASRQTTLDSSGREGFVAVEGGKIWFRLLSGSVGIPLVVIHGGPGLPHDYMQTLSALAGRQAILFYDQLGCGRSDRPTNAKLWRIDRFVRELGVVLSRLEIKRYHLLGHSCGAMIALEHALERPQGLRSVIFASPVFSTAQFISDINSYRSALPWGVRRALRRNEEAGTLSSEDFLQATRIFYERHVCRIVPSPPAYLEAAAKASQIVYQVMWGPTEFICTGNLKTYDQTERLKDLDVRVLLTCGRWDGVKPNTLAFYQSIIKNSRMKVFANSAHMAHLEEPELYLETVQGFLDDVNVDALI